MKIVQGKLPTRIHPDGIIDSVVIVKFDTDISKRKITDLVMSAIADTGLYSDFIKYSQRKRLQLTDTEYRDEPSFFSDGNLKIQIDDDSIAFNCAGKYLGWDHYRYFIKIVLSTIDRYCTFNYAELRYVSKFDDVSILQCLDGEIRFNQLPIFAGTELKFGYEVIGPKGKIAEAKVILTADKLSPYNKKRASFVDIKMRSSFTGSADLTLERIDELHYHEKYTFFSLLSEDFFKERGVSYD